MARSALAAQAGIEAATDDAPFLNARRAVARFYADQVLTQAEGLARIVTDGGGSVMALAEDEF